MRKGMCLATLVVAGILGQASGVVLNENPAPFRGEVNTTFQAWDFLSGAPSEEADLSTRNNINGIAKVDFASNSLVETYWSPEDHGQQGVWAVGRTDPDDRDLFSEMTITVPNYSDPRQEKKIWLQIVYTSQEGHAPMIGVIGVGAAGDQSRYETMNVVSQFSHAVGTDYYYAVYSISIKPNPTLEQFFIRPRDCEVFVDSICIETQCIPEPITMVLLGLGGLILRKRFA